MDLRHSVPDPSFIHTRRRESSSSASSISSSGAGPAQTKHSQRPLKGKRTKAPSSRDVANLDEGRGPLSDPTSSRRESASSMRTTSTMDDPVTYTPTTHRISKAKKGKRVHACEYPGCNKVFTRAEHRRRHELNHSPEASFPCTRPDCRKAFHRPDLLARHIERHDLEDQAQGTASPLSSHRRAHVHPPIAPEVSPSITSQTMASPPLVSVPSQPHHSNPVTIGSLVHPPNHDRSMYGNALGMDFGSQARNVYQMSLVNSSDDSAYFYSSPESASPISDHYPRYTNNHRSSLSSSSSVIDMYSSNTTATPLIASTLPGWTPVIPANITSAHGLDEDLNAISSVGHPVSIPLSNMDGDDWTTLRRELGRVPGTVSDDSGLAVIDLVKWSDCLELYQRHFKPSFPMAIVHTPSFWSSNPSPVVAGVMVGIGSQYDSRPNSKKYSMALLEASSKILSKRDHTTGQSRLADLQSVFLLEALSRFGSRRIDVDTSSRFRVLYASLAQARHWVLTSPLAVFKSLKGNYAPAEIKKAYNFWVDHETRRRILQSCFVLDTLQSVLFGQQLVLGQTPPSRLRGANLQGDMPFPCSSSLWECPPGQEWCAHASNSVHDNLSLREATQMALSTHPEPLDSFQAVLVFSHILMHDRHLPSFTTEVQTYYSNIPLFSGIPGSLHPLLVEFTYHALLAAHYTPVRKLLMVSGESWMYGRKVEDEADFRKAKIGLREWVDAGSVDKVNSGEADVLKAVWHATRLLSLTLGSPASLSFNPSSSIGGSLFPPSVLEMSDDVRPSLNVLHEPWSIYLCGLICWAYGFDSAPTSTSLASTTTASSRGGSLSSIAASQSTSISSGSLSSSVSAHPALLPGAGALDEARSYLGDMTSPALHVPGHLLRLDPNIRGRTDGLLETIRTRKLSGGDSGLMNEADRVLFRLVEKRGRGWAF